MSGFSIFHWIIFGFIFWIIWKVFFGSNPKSESMYCTACGHEGETKITTKGSMGIEIVLWICFIAPGIIYSLWRINSRHKTCSACGSSALVPKTSPVAMAQKKRLAQP